MQTQNNNIDNSSISGHGVYSPNATIGTQNINFKLEGIIPEYKFRFYQSSIQSNAFIVGSITFIISTFLLFNVENKFLSLLVSSWIFGLIIIWILYNTQYIYTYSDFDYFAMSDEKIKYKNISDLYLKANILSFKYNNVKEFKIVMITDKESHELHNLIKEKQKN